MMAAPGADGSGVHSCKTVSGTNSRPSMPILSGSTPLTASAMSGPASATMSLALIAWVGVMWSVCRSGLAIVVFH